MTATSRRTESARLGLTDFVGFGGGFGLLEPMVRYGLDAHRAMNRPYRA